MCDNPHHDFLNTDLVPTMSYEETKRALRVSPEVQNDYQMYAFLDRKVDEGYILGAGLDEDGDVIFALTPKGRTLE